MGTRKLAIMALLVSIAVAGSTFVSFPAGIARAYPIQHAVNVAAAVFLGPVPAMMIAGVTAVIRVLTGTGSLLAFPGGMIGAAFAGILFQKTGRIWTAAVGEMIGTGLIASLLAVPYAAVLMGTSVGAFFFLPPFLVSSMSGAVIGGILASRLLHHPIGRRLQQL
ncbi:energy coupling factor transporter S component ThiW [Sporosarcina aquimarina]|uniref:Energy coupling factor transporter S component ThiW n=1 Tax=Sporosarcina aquimarina TaxID=114975 RepID=A0ABU4FYY8_9BACL|nr:energy coupling factor transporter S component ThiW [Sporosarcina aquimarina]MDW0109938.1 energy coupling factor transporter S component ThiW [Sporosarcina aquimarina]